MESKKETAKFCGNILVRKTKRRSFLAKSLFEGVFGVLTEGLFEYYHSSTQWTKGEKPEFFIELFNIQSVEEVDDDAFSQTLCFQVTYHCRTKKDNYNTRTLYLSAYDVDEFESWLSSLRLACVDNPVSLTQYHSGRFTGKGWSCCKAATFRSSPGCKPSTIYGIPDVKRQKLSQAIAFHGFGVIALESHYSDLPGSLPFSAGDHLTVSDASGNNEWKAFSTTSTSGYGYIPKDLVKLKDLEEEPWFFDEIPNPITAAILRDQVPGCFILRTSGLGTRTILSFRTDRTVKHIEVLLDETTQKYRVKDESDAVSYANFLQFDSIQQLLDQCKQHATLGITLEKYPTIKNADEIWRVDWGEIEIREESDLDLPWSVNYGKFHNKDALIQALPEGSSDILKEKFSNQARLMMTLNHDNLVKLHGVGIKGPRNFMVQENLSNGNLSEYLLRNSSLLQSYPTELGNIMSHVINGMVYLHECWVVHGELVPKNCLVGDKGIIKISGFHCSRSPWCKRPLSDEVYSNKVPIPAPEAGQSIATFSSDVWAYGLFIYSVATVGQQPITDLQQVLNLKAAEDTLNKVGSLVERISACLQMEPTDRPTFPELCDQVSDKVGSSTPSCSSHSFEGSLDAQTLVDEVPTVKSTSRKNNETTGECFVDGNGAMAWDNTDIAVSYNQEELRQRLKNAELEALKAKALQKRAEAAKDAILSQVQEAETKCLKEVELMTKTFLMRLNEANDRAAEAEQARYLAEEVKRLTEEKYTLYKYESEKNMHELKSMFDDALLERDELIAALKTVGKDFDAPELISPRRRDSIHQLEEKYQRYISTSDRTIQSLKTQLNGVVKHRDQLAIDREAARNEMKDTREALEQAVKEKEEFQFRLEEAQFEIERLEEMISTMTQKRQQAERERDQLQMLTDMSLMKLRQAESGAPKKRVSLCSFPTKNDERPTEERDPSLRRLSEQLLHLIGPSPMEVQSKSDENDMEEGYENATTDDDAVSSGGQHEQEHPTKSCREEVAVRRPGKIAMPSLPQVKEFRRATPTRRRENYSNQNTSWDTGDPSASHKFAHINYHQTKDDEKQSEQWYHSRKHEPETSTRHEESKEAIAHSIDQHRKDSIKQFTIPTLHIEEADTDSEMDHQRGVPDIEISEFEDNELIAEEEEEKEFPGSENNGDSPMFIIGDQEGHTRIVYSFDDLPELLQGIPQTSL